MEKIGFNIGNWRRFRRMSADELASVIGVGRATLWRYEVGKNEIGAAKLQEISKALDVKIEEFYK